MPNGLRLEFVVDDAGRIVEALEYRSGDVLWRRHSNTYDLNGNATHYDRYFSDGTLEHSYVATYVRSQELAPNVLGFEAVIRDGILSGENDFSMPSFF